MCKRKEENWGKKRGHKLRHRFSPPIALKKKGLQITYIHFSPLQRRSQHHSSEGECPQIPLSSRIRASLDFIFFSSLKLYLCYLSFSRKPVTQTL